MNIVTIGGGSGQFVLLSALRDIKDIDIKSIVSMVDSGGSTGRLRDELGVLPPGDIMKCVLALSKDRDKFRKLLQKRFNIGILKGHSVGNMLLTMLYLYTKNFSQSVYALGEILDIKGEVIPVTTDKATLVAELEDKTLLYGESAIDVPKNSYRKKIINTFLVPHHNNKIKPHPKAISSIKNADFILIGPGDLYTSIIPNLLVPSISKTISKSKAKLIYILNIMTKSGETDNFSAKDFINKIESLINKKIDIIICNNKIPSKNILYNYQKQKAYPVNIDITQSWHDKKIIIEDILSTKGNIARHDINKLQKCISKIIFTAN